MIFNVFHMTPALYWMVFNFKATTINLLWSHFHHNFINLIPNFIKSYAHVLRDVSIYVVKKLKSYRSFIIKMHKETVFLEILTENKTLKKWKPIDDNRCQLTDRLALIIDEIDNHKKLGHRLFIDYRYQSINWHRLSSIDRLIFRSSVSSIVHVL